MAPLCYGLGALLAWRPGVIVPKPSFPVSSLRALEESGTEKGQVPGNRLRSGLRPVQPPGRPSWGISQSLLRDRARRSGSEPEERSERSRGKDVGEGSERQVGREEVMVIRRREKPPGEGERDKGRWMNKRQRERELGKHTHGSFLWGGAGWGWEQGKKLHKQLTLSPNPSRGEEDS